MKPVRVQAKAWSPKASTSPPQPGGPQRAGTQGQREAQAAAQGQKHCFGRKHAGRLTRYGSQSTKHRPVGQTATGEGRRRKGTGKAAACVREGKRFEYAMHSTAIHVASRPSPGRSREVDGLPLRLLPEKGTRANPPPGGARVPQPHFSGSAHTHRRYSKQARAGLSENWGTLVELQ